MNHVKHKIAIDLDNTIVNTSGSEIRDGMKEILKSLSAEHEVILWTNAPKSRVYQVVFENFREIRPFFSRIICRETYDPEGLNLPKDLRLYGLDLLIDDDPDEISFNLKNGKAAFLVRPFHRNSRKDRMNVTSLREFLTRETGTAFKPWSESAGFDRDQI